MSTATTSMEFFDRKYRDAADPWCFATSAYELDRYNVILRCLSGRRYERVFEPGCSIGVLTEQLASVSSHVLAMDISPVAAERARERCADLAQVEVRCGSLSSAMPDGRFDLIALVEVGYYFHAPELIDIAEQLIDRLSPGGTLLAEHWLGVSQDHLLSGDQVHELLDQTGRLSHDFSLRQQHFRLDRWRRP